jgi:hypothetical protein
MYKHHLLDSKLQAIHNKMLISYNGLFSCKFMLVLAMLIHPMAQLINIYSCDQYIHLLCLISI